MGHEGRTLRWETKVGARRTDFINESIFVKRHLCKSYKPQFKLKESKMIKLCRKNDLFLATVYINLRSSAEVFCKKSVLKNFANFTGKHLCWNLLLSKLQALQALQLY